MSLTTKGKLDRPTEEPQHPVNPKSHEQQVRVWQEQLQNAPFVLEMLTDRPRAAVSSMEHHSYPFIIDAEHFRKLQALSTQLNVELSIILLAAFNALLQRYTRQDEILTGLLRDNAEFTMSRVVFSPNLLFTELCQQLHDFTNMMQSTPLPFVDLTESLESEIDFKRHPIIQALLQYSQSSIEHVMITLDEQFVPLDLSLTLWEKTEGLEGVVSYRANLFHETTIERFVQHLTSALESVVTHPQQKISHLPILTPQMYDELLFVWNETQAEFPNACVHQLFETRTEQHPETTAIVYGKQQLTYAELNHRANQLAHYLRGFGVQSGDFVGICMERSAEAVVAFLAIMKAGATYVPIDPAYPQDRRDFMMEDTQIKVLLTQERLAENLEVSGRDTKIILVDSDWGIIAENRGDNLNLPVHPEDIVYVIYTSGSTGKPKGVLIPHRGLVNHNFAIIHKFDLEASDRVLQFASLSFDVAGEEIYPTLLSGATLVIHPSGQAPSIVDFLRELEAQQVSVLNLPTPYWHEWTHALEDGDTPFPSNLRLLVVGSERAAPERLEAWQQKTPKRIPMFNAYGLTETSITSLVYNIPYDPLTGHEVPIGKPLANTQVYILDTHMQPAPMGVAGELYIGGIGLAKGYLNRPDLTSEKFIDNPFVIGAKLYKTGDLMRYLNDGSIEFLGRIDQQAKIRGYRIELGEIEAALSEYPQVLQSVVIVREDKPEHKYVAAYFVPSGDEVPTAFTLRNFLKERLPEYMIPAAFVSLEAIPLTANGKVDRRGLPVPQQAQSSSDQSYVAPRTPTEHTLARLWGDILNNKRVGIYDDFFELGGHSLLAARLTSQIRKAFGIELPLTTVFEERTVAGLAQRIEAPTSEISSIVPVSREDILPQSFAQQRVWFLNELEPESRASYNIPQAFHLIGDLNVSVLEQCLNEILRRHEALRTQLVLRDGQPIQIIQLFQPLKLSVVDFSHLSDAQQRTERKIIEEARKPFDLAGGLLIHTLLLKTATQQHTLICSIHHSVADGWSMDLFGQELAALYDAFIEGKPSPLPELSIQYADYAHWQRQWLQGDTLGKQLNYWQQQLAGDTTVAELPPDHPRPPMQTFDGAAYHFTIPQPLADTLGELSRQEGVTLYITLLAALQTLLLRYTGSEQITVGTAVANRTRAEIESLIGFFVNTLVLRTDVSGNPSFRALMRRAREVAFGAYAHQDFPFDQLVEAMKPERDRSRTPLFQILFVWEENPLPTLEFGGLTMRSELIDNGTAKFDLSIYMRDHNGKLSGYIEYNTRLFEESTVQRLLGHFVGLMEGIAVNPDQSLFQLPLLTNIERQELLYHWNQTGMDYPTQANIHHLFEAQVARTPDNIAAVFGNGQLTYRQLNDRANQLAHYLIAQGVVPDTLVGLCIERSLDMLVALLGILKAGGGYVPLDPNFPPDRLAYMLEDSQAPVLLTQESLRNFLPPHNAHVACLDTDWEQIARVSGANPDNPNVEMSPRNLAYVIYTSGSTGKPKGVQLEHGGVVNFLVTMQQQPGMKSDDVLLAVTTISFDIHVLEMFLPLTTGACTVILPREIITDGVRLMEQLARHRATVIQATPATFRLLIEAGWQGDKRLKILCGGEPLPRVLANQLVERCAELWNMYGPTETTVWSTCHRIEAGDGVISIGRPIGNTQLYILDPFMQPVPIGVAGELYIGGDSVARGYFQRPELTEQRFIANPFMENARMYKTGDLARYLPDSTLQFFGRMDHQIKLRGFRIELGEIETVLAKHSAVRQNTVIVREDTPGNPRLVAYIVLTEANSNISVNEWRAHLKESLPDYMIPSAFVTLEKMPLTPNGKINRQGLPTPVYEFDNETFVAPRTTAEKTLAAIWSESLGLQRVGIHDNFFELGGHSLIAVKIFAQIEKRFGQRLPLATLFQTPTIENLAKLLDNEISQKTTGQSLINRLSAPIVEIQPKGTKPPFFCVGGGVINLRYLSQQLGDDQPFYALQSESLDGYQAIHANIEEIAEFFIQAMREMQPQGPYFIGGCYGSGMVALEIARQLQLQGQQVAFVGIFNTRPRLHAERRSLHRRVRSRLFNWGDGNIKGFWGNIRGVDLQHAQEALQSTTWRYAVKIFRRLKRPLPNILRTGIYEEFLVRRVGRNYRPTSPYDGNITLFFTYDWYSTLMEIPKWGWEKLVNGEVDPKEVPGVPCDMFLPPHVHVLGQHFRETIDQAQKTSQNHR
jgi:amino acid adenylation domain-containing protein